MRLATGLLIALVACLWLGLAEAASPPAPPAGACPQACNKASACAKATACNKETACSTATACSKAACGKAACDKTAAPACAGQKSCATASTCQGQPGCDNSACNDAVMAAMFGDMVVCGKALQCSQLTAAEETAAYEPSCETAATCKTTGGCETACASKKACCEAAASCEKMACQQAACAKATACASTLACNKAACCNKATACNKTMASNKTAACGTATTCHKSTPCETAAGCQATACAAAGECPQVIATDCASSCESGSCCKAKAAAVAVVSDETCAGSAGCSANACCQASDCTTDACPSAACPTTVKLTHLVKAAEHLAAAGLTDDADCVRAMAVEVRQELVSRKVAQIASLQAEIAALGGDCESAGNEVAARCEQRPPQNVSEWMNTRPTMKARDQASQQVSVNVKCVEVSLSKLKQFGFVFPAMEPYRWKGDGSAFLHFMEALEHEGIAKVTSLPTVVMADGATFEVNSQEHGMHLDIQAKVVNDKQVCVRVRPRSTGAGAAAHTGDAGLQMEFGKTAAMSGLVRLLSEQDPYSSKPIVAPDVQTLILVTPELVKSANAVQPVNHEEPTEELGIQTHRVGQRVKALHIFETRPSQPQPRVRYSFPAEAR